MWRNLLSALGSYASLAGLYYTLRPSYLPLTTVEELLVVTSVILIAVHLALEIVGILRSRPKLLKTDADMKAYMNDWIKMAGRTSILSRDLSWVDIDMERILTELAVHSNLTIFMERENLVSMRLRSAGAEIFTYESATFPSARFAITNEGRSDARVALGAKNRNGHLEVREYAVGDAAFHMCADIVGLIRGRKRRF